ncbi:MAG: hypothetical protein ACRDUV_27255 [Pseudonocardiaceae bacterium]
MVADGNGFYGRKEFIELVRALMAREMRGGSLHSRHSPILVIEGCRGAGKTALLSKLADLLDQQVPYARLDFEPNKQVSVPQVLSALAFDLNRKCPRYGALPFPRFIVGQLIMKLDLDLTDRSRARQQVIDELAQHRGPDVFIEVLQDAASDVLDILGRSFGVPVRVADRGLRRLVKRLTERVMGRRIVLGAFQEWYGHRDLGLPHDSIDVLIELRRKSTDYDDEDNRQWVDDLLWAAFLADLRAELGRRRWADDRSLNCVLLLDNADTYLARRFLSQLDRARRERAVGERDDADPLTVVVTSRGVVLGDVPDAHLADAPDLGRTAGASGDPRSGQLPGSTDWSHAWWLRYRLPDLTEDEIGRAILDMALGWGDNLRLTRVVYRLTGGHPASTRLVLQALATFSPQKWIEPEAILGQNRPDTLSRRTETVEAQILARLLGEVTSPTQRDLETCAAAREREQTLVLAGQDDLLVSGQANFGEDLDPILWPADESAGPALLRRLLRRRLAQRDDAALPSWSKVNARLRYACRTRGDEAGELYYALAEGELGFVTRRLHQRLEELESVAWAELLTHVTGAPTQHRHHEVPIDEVSSLVKSAELDKPLTSVGRLVAALWIAADPFTDSRRRNLHLQIATDYADVSRLCPGGPHSVFLEAERGHRREAEWWD